MELSKISIKFSEVIKKYKYAALVLIIGIVLMAIPFGNQAKDTIPIKQDNVTNQPVVSLEDKLSELLSNVDGAGEVKVMLTVETGEEVIYQTDDNHSVADSTNNINTHTVTVTNSDREQEGLVKQINPEKYKGAIILCHGANDPSVRLQIVEAVSRITGLGTNCISVLKMK